MWEHHLGHGDHGSYDRRGLLGQADKATFTTMLGSVVFR